MSEGRLGDLNVELFLPTPPYGHLRIKFYKVLARELNSLLNALFN